MYIIGIKINLLSQVGKFSEVVIPIQYKMQNLKIIVHCYLILVVGYIANFVKGKLP